MDFNRFIIIRHSATRGQFTATKSRKDRRVDLSKELRRGLLELRDKRILEAVSSGDFDELRQPRLAKLVFPSETGGPINGSNVFNRDFLPVLEAAGIRRVTFHALRHPSSFNKAPALPMSRSKWATARSRSPWIFTGTSFLAAISAGLMPWTRKQLRANPQPPRNHPLPAPLRYFPKLLK